MIRINRDIHWHLVLAGAATEVVLIGLLLVPERLGAANSVLLIELVGFAGGLVVGRRVEDDEQSGFWHGLLVGTVGGLVFGGLVAYTFLLNETRGFLYAFNLWILRNIPIPNAIAVNYGTEVVALIALVSGFIVASTTACVAALVASSHGFVEPPRE